MKILVADDQETNRRLLKALLAVEGYSVMEAHDGAQALEALKASEGPIVALLDWQMPEVTGPEICRAIRDHSPDRPMFLILVTVRDSADHVVTGLESGANDYITKPFEPSELVARVKIGVQVASLQDALASRVRELEDALSQVKQLRGLLPICSYCKNVRNDQDYWQRVEEFVQARTDLQFSHGVCPDCWDHRVKPQLERIGISSERIDKSAPPRAQRTR